VEARSSHDEVLYMVTEFVRDGVFPLTVMWIRHAVRQFNCGVRAKIQPLHTDMWIVARLGPARAPCIGVDLVCSASDQAVVRHDHGPPQDRCHSGDVILLGDRNECGSMAKARALRSAEREDPGKEPTVLLLLDKDRRGTVVEDR